MATAAEGLATSAVAVALAWVRDRPGVTAPILGARTLGQLTAALGCEMLDLPEEISRSTRRRLGATAWLPGGRPLSDSDPVFVAFCDAGLWPGLGPKLVPALAEAGIRGPADVSTANLATLPKVGTVRAGRLLSSFLAAAPVYEVVELLVPAALDPGWRPGCMTSLGRPPPGCCGRIPGCCSACLGSRIADADRLARAAIPGVTRDDPRRARALVGFLLARDARDGHTVSPRAEHRGGPASVRCR